MKRDKPRAPRILPFFGLLLHWSCSLEPRLGWQVRGGAGPLGQASARSEIHACLESASALAVE